MKRLPRDHGWIDYRRGLDYACRKKNLQPRADGPPLLFKTDTRASILCVLALSGRPMRQDEINTSVQRQCSVALTRLAEVGMLAKCVVGRKELYYDLDWAHPAAEELRELYLRLSQIYVMPRPRFDFAAPSSTIKYRGPERYDLVGTFGGAVRTLPLLMIFIRGSASGEQIARCMPSGDRKFTLRILRMFKAFGVLESQRVSRGIHYSFSSQCPFVGQLRQVLGVLDREMPHWRAIAERDTVAPRYRRESRIGHRRNKRWRW